MGGGGGGGENGEPEFQIAPMIDVLLTLLIFFMSITTAQVAKVDKEIVLPVAKDAKKRDPENAMNEVVVNVRWDANRQESTITMQERKYAQSELEELIVILTKRKAEVDARYQNAPPASKRTLTVIIRGDHQLPAVEIQKVMALVGQAGCDDVSFSALDKKG